MTVNTGDTVRITAILDDSLAGQVANVWWANQVTGTATDSAFMTAAATRLESAYTQFDHLMPDTVTFEEIQGYNVTQAKPLPTVSWPTLVSGTVDVADPLPSVLSCLGFGRTGQHRVILKKYFGPFTEANQVDAEWDTAVPSACSAALTNAIVAFVSGTGTAQFGVYSKVFATWYPVIEKVVRSVIAYQRRRKRGVGA